MYRSINIFPTTLYLGDLDNHKDYKNSFYKIYSKFDYEDDNWHNTTSENSGNPLIHLEESLEPLFMDIVSHVENYIYEVLKYKKIFDIIIQRHGYQEQEVHQIILNGTTIQQVTFLSHII